MLLPQHRCPGLPWLAPQLRDAHRAGDPSLEAPHLWVSGGAHVDKEGHKRLGHPQIHQKARYFLSIEESLCWSCSVRQVDKLHALAFQAAADFLAGLRLCIRGVVPFRTTCKRSVTQSDLILQEAKATLHFQLLLCRTFCTSPNWWNGYTGVGVHTNTVHLLTCVNGSVWRSQTTWCQFTVVVNCKWEFIVYHLFIENFITFLIQHIYFFKVTFKMFHFSFWTFHIFYVP